MYTNCHIYAINTQLDCTQDSSQYLVILLHEKLHAHGEKTILLKLQHRKKLAKQGAQQIPPVTFQTTGSVAEKRLDSTPVLMSLDPNA